MTHLRLPEPLPFDYVDEYLTERFHFYTYDMVWDDEILGDGLTDVVISACRPMRGMALDGVELSGGYSNHIRSAFDLLPDSGYEHIKEDEEGYHHMKWVTGERNWEAFDDLPSCMSGIY